EPPAGVMRIHEQRPKAEQLLDWLVDRARHHRDQEKEAEERIADLVRRRGRDFLDSWERIVDKAKKGGGDRVYSALDNVKEEGLAGGGAGRARVAALRPAGREERMSPGKKQKRVTRPEGQLRQSQLITTFGPGSMVDLVDRAVVIGGLEHWGYGKDSEGEALDDPRLRRALIPRLKALHQDLDLAKSHYFRKPPEGDVRDPFPSVGVRA